MRIASLDVLRGIAILLVLVCHSFVSGPNESNTFLGGLVRRVADFGWTGVDLFFVLSGFLITSIILREREKPRWLAAFWVKRVFRILPVYFLTLAGVLLACHWFGQENPEASWLISHQWMFWLQVQNFIPDGESPWWPSFMYSGHFWTLAVEWQFYMLWPFVAGYLPYKKIALVCSLGIVTAITMRVLLSDNGADYSQIYTSTLCRMDSLLFGALASVLITNVGAESVLSKYPKAPHIILAATGVLIVSYFIFEGWYSPTNPVVYTVGFSVNAVFFSSLIIVILSLQFPDKPASFATRFLSSVGKYSYGTYILHWPCYWLIWHYAQPIIGKNMALQIFYLPFVVGSALFLGFLSWRVIEEWSNLYGGRIASRVVASESNHTLSTSSHHYRQD